MQLDPARRRRRRRDGTTPDADGQSRFRSLMSELGFAIAPRLMTPADTLGYAGFQFSAELGVTKINPDRQIGDRAYWDGIAGVEPTNPTAIAPDSYLTTVGGYVRKGLWIPLPAFEFGAGALSILGLAHVRAAGLREARAAGRLPRLVAAVVRGARRGVAAARHRPRST